MRCVLKDTYTRTQSRASRFSEFCPITRRQWQSETFVVSLCYPARGGRRTLPIRCRRTPSATDSVPKPDSVERWGDDVLKIEREISFMMLTNNELKAKLSFTRSRQTVKARELATLGPLLSEEQAELLQSQQSVQAVADWSTAAAAVPPKEKKDGDLRVLTPMFFSDSCAGACGGRG